MSNTMNSKSALSAESLNTWGSPSTLGIGSSYLNKASSSQRILTGVIYVTACFCLLASCLCALD